VVDPPAHLDAVDPRHHHVEHHHPGPGAVRRGQVVERLLAAGRLGHLEPVGLQHRLDDPPDGVVVVDHEHAPPRRSAAAHFRSVSTEASPVR
jgi:hypothetical protein